jgi:hypothetical protein
MLMSICGSCLTGYGEGGGRFNKLRDYVVALEGDLDVGIF